MARLTKNEKRLVGFWATMSHLMNFLDHHEDNAKMLELTRLIQERQIQIMMGREPSPESTARFDELRAWFESLANKR